MLDIVEKGKEGNRAIINYNNKEGWILYKSRSDLYATEFMETEKKYTRGNPSDHKAQKVTLMLDIVEKGKEGNRAIINYNNKEGWILYKTKSDLYAKDIRETVEKFKDKNDRQQAFKQIMHKLDIECFGIKYKKAKAQRSVWVNINIRKLRNSLNM